MACEHDQTELILLCYDELPAAERQAAESRALQCADCRTELEELRQGAAVLAAAAPAVSASEATLRRTEQAVLRLPRPGKVAWLAHRRAPAWLWPAALAASLLIGAGVGLWPQLSVPIRPAQAPAVPKAGFQWQDRTEAQLQQIAWEVRRLQAPEPLEYVDIDETLQELQGEILRLRAEITGDAS